MISERTTKALAAAKARGVRLGSKKPGRWLNKQNNWAGAKAKAVTACQQKARGHYEALLPEIKARRDAGHTVGEIADWLNSKGYVTSAQKSLHRAGRVADSQAVLRRIASLQSDGTLRSRRKDGALQSSLVVARRHAAPFLIEPCWLSSILWYAL